MAASEPCSLQHASESKWTRDASAAAWDYVTVSTSTASSEAWFSITKPSPCASLVFRRYMEFLETIQNQIIWKAKACWLFINILAATILPKIKWHARTGGCVLQPRNALTAAEKSCSLNHDLPALEKPA